jgi:hypothetical protein
MASQYGDLKNWHETSLWEELESRYGLDSDSIRVALKQCMPEIQAVLMQGGTASTDFTLHDAGHGFRVAQRMAQIIPSDVLPELTTYELALLLLSAYLHDIGMTPERSKVTDHYLYLMTGESQRLSESETAQLQAWLDDEGRGISPPLVKQKPSAKDLKLADELITYYSRYRHNDWSEEWIRGNLSAYQLGTYINWIDDLVTLCRSHHYGYQELVKDSFNPRIVGTPARTVHLRYLACVLRIADVLEFDPERTPQVILRHRDISSGSLIYWWKDQHISMKQEGKRLVVSARPPSSLIHKAIEVTVDQIDDELRLCRTIADETHFEVGPGLAESLPHRWDLAPSVHRDISPKDNSYEYIEGSFRPDTERLLELLSGVALYGSPMNAVRELLQNAFDAVREQIAYQRLSQPDPLNPNLENILGHLHHVNLALETSDGSAWLVCTDTGVGMTKSIIKDHLLVSGAARRHDVLSLERKCKTAGFPLGRTGQFGIGVLSYFMIADRVMIKTRRSQDTGDAEVTGWEFETEGAGSFGELRKEHSIQKGTQVRLRLRAEITGDDLLIWFDKVKDYLRSSLLHIPCQFEFKTDSPKSAPLALDTGWARKESDFSRIPLEQLNRPTVPSTRRMLEDPTVLRKFQRGEIEEQNWETMREEMLACLHWRVQDGELPDGLGRFRLRLPYFDLPGGASLGFLRCNEESGSLFIKGIGDALVYFPEGYPLIGWRGINIPNKERSWPGLSYERPRKVDRFIAEINWEASEACRLAVNRNDLQFTDEAKAAVQYIYQVAVDMCKAFVLEHKDSAYSTLNCRILNEPIPESSPLNWVTPSNDSAREGMSWQPLDFPVVKSSSASSLDVMFIMAANFLQKGAPEPPPNTCEQDFTYDGKRVYLLSDLECIEGSILGNSNYRTLHLASRTFQPDRVVIYPGDKLSIRALWTRRPMSEASTNPVGITCAFPEEWMNLCGVYIPHYYSDFDGTVLWNPDTPLLKAVDSSAWEWCKDTFDQSLDPIAYRDELLAQKSRAAAWLMRYIQSIESDEAEAFELWGTLEKEASSFLEELWRILFGWNTNAPEEHHKSLCLWIENPHNPRLGILSPSGWLMHDKLSTIEQYIPRPGREWYLELG